MHKLPTSVKGRGPEAGALEDASEMATGSKKLAKKKVARMLASAEGVRLLSSCVSGELVLRARRAMLGEMKPLAVGWVPAARTGPMSFHCRLLAGL